jgi:hypothetical protein
VTSRKLLLLCGVLSSLLYVAMNLFVAMRWEEYSSVSQTVSELSAIGAPTRALWIRLGFVYTLLVIAFAWGVWRSGGRNRPLRIAGGLMISYGVVSLAWPLAPMHLRGAEFTLTDSLHITLAMVTVLLMLLAIGFGARALGHRFRRYSVVTMAVLLAFGVLTAIESPRIAANLPTPWIGVWERINIAAFLLWIVVLAIALWGQPPEPVANTGAIAQVGNPP